MEHGPDLGAFLLAFAAALVAARVFGEAAQRIGQPAVLGELIAGVVIGPAALGLVPISESIILLAEIGVILLLFEVGLETDLEELARVGGTATAVAAVGMILPFAGGWLVARALGHSSLTAVFVGAALTATSIGITARVLSEIRALETREGRVILGAAVVDDVLGLVVLAVVSRIAEHGTLDAGDVARSLLLSIAFLTLAVAVGVPLSRRLVGIVSLARVRGVLLTAAVAFTMLVALAAKAAGSAPIVGAFAAGLVLARTNRRRDIDVALRPVVDIFAPLFFVYVGAQVEISRLNPLVAENRPALLLALLLTVVGFLGKFASGYAARGGMRRSFIGAGMVPRGEVGLIFAEAGRRTGALGEDAFGAVVVAVFATTFLAPPLLKALRPREAPRS